MHSVGKYVFSPLFWALTATRSHSVSMTVCICFGKFYSIFFHFPHQQPRQTQCVVGGGGGAYSKTRPAALMFVYAFLCCVGREVRGGKPIREKCNVACRIQSGAVTRERQRSQLPSTDVGQMFGFVTCVVAGVYRCRVGNVCAGLCKCVTVWLFPFASGDICSFFVWNFLF